MADTKKIGIIVRKSVKNPGYLDIIDISTTVSNTNIPDDPSTFQTLCEGFNLIVNLNFSNQGIIPTILALEYLDILASLLSSTSATAFYETIFPYWCVGGSLP